MERCVERCEGFKVVDANKQTVAYVYGHAADIAGSMTLDQARRVAANIAKLPKLLGKG
jgi:hypothetical protein